MPGPGHPALLLLHACRCLLMEQMNQRARPKFWHLCLKLWGLQQEEHMADTTSLELCVQASTPPAAEKQALHVTTLFHILIRP